MISCPAIDKMTTTGDSYADVFEWDTRNLSGLIFLFSAETKNLNVRILGSLDGVSYPITITSEFTIVAAATATEIRISKYYPYIKIQVKPASAGQHGTLATQAVGTDGLGSGEMAIDQAEQGTNNVIVAGYKTKRLSVTFAGIGATAQYDAVGTLTEVVGWASANGRGATLRRLWIEVNNNAIAPQFELHFFNASNPTVATDNVTWTSLAADAAKRSGYLQVPPCAKPTGSGTIDIVRAQAPDNDGYSLDMQMTCAAASTSLWLALKLLTSGISFAGSPGNTITVVMEIEQS